MNEIIRWSILVLIASLLAGCGAVEALPTVVVSPTFPAASPTPVPPTPSPTPKPPPTPTPTDAPRAEVELNLPDTSWTFWDPNVREQQLQSVADQSGIYTVITLDQNHVRLIYDPSQLTQKEALQTFEGATGMRAEVSP